MGFIVLMDGVEWSGVDRQWTGDWKAGSGYIKRIDRKREKKENEEN